MLLLGGIKLDEADTLTGETFNFALLGFAVLLVAAEKPTVEEASPAQARLADC